MTLASLLGDMAEAARRGDGAAFANVFSDDGAYHDVFYGTFRGRADLATFIEDRVHRDGQGFRWTFHDVVEADGRGYGRYLFSYVPKSIEAGTRVVFEGIGFATMRDGLLLEYNEVANPYPALSMMGLGDERIARFAGRQAEDLRARPEAAQHLT
ncbi:MAG: nuclear transport factor 2 family protein [Pseudomonadota bacterium]